MKNTTPASQLADPKLKPKPEAGCFSQDEAGQCLGREYNPQDEVIRQRVFVEAGKREFEGFSKVANDRVNLIAQLEIALHHEHTEKNSILATLSEAARNALKKLPLGHTVQSVQLPEVWILNVLKELGERAAWAEEVITEIFGLIQVLSRRENPIIIANCYFGPEIEGAEKHRVAGSTGAPREDLLQLFGFIQERILRAHEDGTVSNLKFFTDRLSGKDNIVPEPVTNPQPGENIDQLFKEIDQIRWAGSDTDQELHLINVAIEKFRRSRPL